jgi:hypothetical protein
MTIKAWVQQKLRAANSFLHKIAAVLAWLRWQYMDQYYTSLKRDKKMTLADVIFWEKRLSAAHRRFVQACLRSARSRKQAQDNISAF